MTYASCEVCLAKFGVNRLVVSGRTLCWSCLWKRAHYAIGDLPHVGFDEYAYRLLEWDRLNPRKGEAA